MQASLEVEDAPDFQDLDKLYSEAGHRVARPAPSPD